MPERDPTDEEKAMSPATGKPIGRHEAAGLKGLSKEQHPKFWEEVTLWNKQRFAEAKWQEILKRIRRVKQEHCMFVLGWHPPLEPRHSIATSGGRHLLLYSSSSLTAPTGAHPLRPPHLPRIETSSPITPRPRWDVVCSGPVTPLSATSAGPVKNAFAEGGFWASLATPKTPLTARIMPTTPVTATPLESWVPDTPTDPEAKTVYEEIKHDVNKRALQLCASRYALRRSSSTDYDVIHPSMVRPKDTLLAAQLDLESRRLPRLLSSYIDNFLPSKVDAIAITEAAAARQYSIPSREQLDDVDAWLQFDEATGELTTILEAQRDLLKMNKDRRKSKEIMVGQGAVRLAWAVKIVDDMEFFVNSVTDEDSEGSDEDAGYDYGNFVRSLGDGEGSSLRSSGSTLNLTLSNTSATQSSSVKSEIAVAQRSVSSPIKPTYGSGHDALPHRSRNLTLATAVPSISSQESKSHVHHHTDSFTSSLPHTIRRSNATARPSRRNLTIDTSCTNHTSNVSVVNRDVETPTISPQERGTRHKGPSIEDLTSWADELKKMERKRAEIRLGGGKWVERQREEKGEDAREIQQELDINMDGMVINGSLHPALRAGGGHGSRETSVIRGVASAFKGKRGASGSSTASWRCKTAAGIEQNGSATSNTSDTIDHDKPTIELNNDDEIFTNSNLTHKHDDDKELDLDFGDAITPTPSFARINESLERIFHPLGSSSSQTHPLFKLSELPMLRISPPRSPPPTLPPQPISPSTLGPSPPRRPLPLHMAIPPRAEASVTGYNRRAATSYERRASYQQQQQQVDVHQRGIGGAALPQDAIMGSERVRSRSKQQKEELDEELLAMERRERKRQLGSGT